MLASLMLDNMLHFIPTSNNNIASCLWNSFTHESIEKFQKFSQNFAYNVACLANHSCMVTMLCLRVGRTENFFVFDWLNSECRVVCSNELNDLIDFEWVLSLEKRLQARFTVPIFVEMNWRWKWCRRTISVIVPIFYRKSIMLRYRKRWPLIQLQWRCVCVYAYNVCNVHRKSDVIEWAV